MFLVMKLRLRSKFFIYKTVITKDNESAFVGIIYRLSQFIILSYIIM